MVFNNFVPAMRLEKCSNKFHHIYLFNITGSNVKPCEKRKKKRREKKNGIKRMEDMT